MRVVKIAVLLLILAGLVYYSPSTATTLKFDNTKDSAIAKDKNIEGNYIVTILPDTKKVLNNPLNGWVLYGNSKFPVDFWDHYDHLFIKDLGKDVKVGDYCHTLYLRLSWALLNPHEDQFGWNTNEALKKMIADARQRGMRLAFRVVVDSRDKGVDFTPQFVRDAGAKGYESKSGNKTVWSPYPDDPIFQAKYEKFIKAFAAQFNNPDEVEFIDGYGLGKWGEGHALIYQDYSNKFAVFKWIMDLYISNFTKVPVAINYHREIGDTISWGAPSPASSNLLDDAVEHGCILRHDAFGMTDYYQQWERDYAAKWLYQRPIIMEGGWVTHQHNIKLDPRKYKTAADVRLGEFDDSKLAHVNMMDFRYGETESWFNQQYSLVQTFNSEGGYRLYPDKISLPMSIKKGAEITITHEWRNLGWGYCPNNIPQWNQKYKVAFALLNKRDSSVVKIFIDPDSDPAKWIKNAPTNYTFKAKVDGITEGEYIWGVGIVDTTKNNTIGISLGAKGAFTSAGWLTLMNVDINKKFESIK